MRRRPFERSSRDPRRAEGSVDADGQRAAPAGDRTGYFGPIAPEGHGGRELDGGLRARLEAGFRADLSGVRVHEGSIPSGRRGALAAARGADMYFRPGLYRPDTAVGRELVTHEVAHVLQQSGGGPGTSGAAALEDEAARAATAVRRGGRATVRGAGRVELRHSELSDQLERLLSEPDFDKGRLFDLLRAAGVRGPVDDPEAKAVVDRRLRGDDRWLAANLLAFGTEPHWPLDALRVRSARSRVWREAEGRDRDIGNIRGDFVMTEGGTEIAIRAYYFPGQTEHRALIVGGHHGTEPQGIHVVEQLRTMLSDAIAAGNPPYYTTILVPTLIERTAHPDWRSAYIPPAGASDMSDELTDTEARYVPTGVTEGSHEIAVDPNRSYLLPGETLGEAAARLAANPGESEIQYRAGDDWFEMGPIHDVPDFRRRSGVHGGRVGRLLPESRLLIRLVERFQPERMAQVHAQRIRVGSSDRLRGAGRMASPRIGYDPRGRVQVDPVTGEETVVPDTGWDTEDAALVRGMVTEGMTRLRDRPDLAIPTGIVHPYHGNVPREHELWDPTDLPTESEIEPREDFASSDATEGALGASFGTYFSVEGAERTGEAGSYTATIARPAATTLTIELPQYDDDTDEEGAGAAGALSHLETLTAELLRDIFLGPP